MVLLGMVVLRWTVLGCNLVFFIKKMVRTCCTVLILENRN